MNKSAADRGGIFHRVAYFSLLTPLSLLVLRFDPEYGSAAFTPFVTTRSIEEGRPRNLLSAAITGAFVALSARICDWFFMKVSS